MACDIAIGVCKALNETFGNLVTRTNKDDRYSLRSRLHHLGHLITIAITSGASCIVSVTVDPIQLISPTPQ